MNQDVFSVIKNNNTAYWIGFLAADGSLHKNKVQLQIGLSSKDREHLEKFLSFLNDNTHQISDRKVKCSNDKYYAASFLTIHNKQIYSDLINLYSLIPNKSSCNIDFLQYIPENYKISFILGYFDGDGYFTNTQKSLNFGFCGNEKLVNNIHQYLHNYFLFWESKEKTRRDTKSKITYSFTITMQQEVLDFCNLYLSYLDSCDLLKRKVDIANEIKIKLESKLSNQKVFASRDENNKICCPICQRKFFGKVGQIYCSQECVHISQRRVQIRPDRGQLKSLIRSKSFLEIGRLYNVTDNTIRKWCDAEHLPRKKKDINKISDTDWELI